MSLWFETEPCLTCAAREIDCRALEAQCRERQEHILALEADIAEAHRQYTRLRDLLIQNGISLEENDGTDEGCTEGLSL